MRSGLPVKPDRDVADHAIPMRSAVGICEGMVKAGILYVFNIASATGTKWTHQRSCACNGNIVISATLNREYRYADGSKHRRLIHFQHRSPPSMRISRGNLIGTAIVKCRLEHLLHGDHFLFRRFVVEPGLFHLIPDTLQNVVFEATASKAEYDQAIRLWNDRGHLFRNLCALGAPDNDEFSIPPGSG